MEGVVVCGSIVDGMLVCDVVDGEIVCGAVVVAKQVGH